MFTKQFFFTNAHKKTDFTNAHTHTKKIFFQCSQKINIIPMLTKKKIYQCKHKKKQTFLPMLTKKYNITIAHKKIIILSMHTQKKSFLGGLKHQELIFKY